eukprot:gene16186-19208_t
MEQYGNKGTFNVEGVLQQNIVNSDYYKELYQRVSTWNEIVDEIYNEVTHAEPWMGGNARGPSTFYCLVYKLFTIKCTEKQIVDLIEHPDSPFIRAAGFMYLRYVGDPKDLFSWYEAYLTDEEEISPAQQGKTVTIGTYIRDLLLDQSYFDTLFPRIPEVAKRQAIKRLGHGNEMTAVAMTVGSLTDGIVETIDEIVTVTTIAETGIGITNEEERTLLQKKATANSGGKQMNGGEENSGGAREPGGGLGPP